MSHFVRFEAFTVENAPLPQATKEVSFDRGQNFRTLTANEQTQGFLVEVEQPFVARLSLPHYFSVQQPLRVAAEEGEPRLKFDPSAVSGSMATIPIVDIKRGGQKSFVFAAWLSILKDATASMAAANNPAVPPFTHTLLEFGANVLNAGGTGLARFAAQPRLSVPSHAPTAGRLIFGETPDRTVPQLAAIFVPNGIDLSLPVPIHIFFSPSTGRKTGQYPFSNGSSGFNSVFQNFLTSGGKRLVNQHVSSKRTCVFVFPLAPPDTYFSGIQDAPRLRLFCLEAAHLVQRLVGGRIMPTARLGRCALSGFSEGGRPLNNVLNAALSGGFPELKELYCLDTVSPAGSDQDANSYAAFLSTARQWLSADADRRLRIYTRSAAMASVRSNLGLGSPVRTNGGAREHESANTTFLFVPDTFWTQLAGEPSVSPDPQYPLSDHHQLMPCIFLQHALANSGFA